MNPDLRDFDSHAAISVRGVRKRFRLGVIDRKSFRDELVYRWLRFRGKDPREKMGVIGDPRLKADGWFHALDGVSFDIRRGEAVGFIGRNGAGKSTMLKILARITEPDEGGAVIRGRVGSLLEVGTGFHPELTGRENVYLNGTILGMTKREIDAKFDEIVDFAEIGPFLDTPVKRYSSGMHVKLAFAVAACLDTDVLLVDEVLAVGDLAFRKKSLDRMKELVDSGKTIVFVSHMIPQIKALCSRCIWFQDGNVFKEGPAEEIADEYMDAILPKKPEPPPKKPEPQPVTEKTAIPVREGTGAVRAKSVSFAFDEARDAWNVFVDYETADGNPWTKCRVAVSVRHPSASSIPLLVLDSSTSSGMYGNKPPKGTIVLGLSPGFRFPAGEYPVDVRLWSAATVADDFPDAAVFSAPESLSMPDWKSRPFRSGLVNLGHGWTVPDSGASGGGPVLVRGGTGDVRVLAISFAFDEARDGWNVFVDYETADGAPWTKCRAAVVFRPEDDPGKALCTFDSSTTPGLYQDKPPHGRIVLQLPPDVRFPEGKLVVDVRLWTGTSVSDDFPAAAEFSPPGRLAAPGWRSPPFRGGRVNLRHSWRVEAAATPRSNPE